MIANGGTLLKIIAITCVTWVVGAGITTVKVVEITIGFFGGPKALGTLEVRVCLTILPFLWTTYHSSYPNFGVGMEGEGAVVASRAHFSAVRR